MHLRSITLKGFKSFPDRTKLEFGPGVSVIVGPNGSGKSNITDAVLWALGEQSPTAVRGQAMQDVIFSGSRGQQARRAAEVELVIDNSDGRAGDLEFTEVSILRRLDRSGEGEYRLNGARCRMIDVLEALSDTGLGKEMHSVVSQGRVETVVSSKPRDRRLLIEEAAGLGKHRKRRRRAQLKLARTQDNLDRALDVEREARSRLRPLKRQAEAAELHERLDRQSTEARWELARDDVRARGAALADAEQAATAARAQRDAVDARLGDVAQRRESAEEALAARGEARERLSTRVWAARTAQERLALRGEQARATAASLEQRAATAQARLTALEAEEPGPGADGARIAALEAELSDLERERSEAIEDEVAGLERRRASAAAQVATREEAVLAARTALQAADARAAAAREARRTVEREAEAARREAARAGGELASVNHFLRARAGAFGLGGAQRALADELEVDEGYELALAAALGGRLRAALAPDRAAGAALLDGAGVDGGSALVAGGQASAGRGPAAAPAPGAERLLDHVRGAAEPLAVASSVLAEAWVVERLDDVPDTFDGIAVTRVGRVWFGAWRELRQVAAGGEDRVLAERNRREALIAASEQAASAERGAVLAVETAVAAIGEADTARDAADGALRSASHARDEAAEEERRAAWTIEQRRSAPDEGPAATRRAQVEAALAAERRLAEQADTARSRREASLAAERGRIAADAALKPQAVRLCAALEAASDAVGAQVAALGAELEADRAAGEGLAGDLRACATEEAELQAELRARAEAVTSVEVAAQQVRDRAAEAETELTALATRLELEAVPAADALAESEREALQTRIERLARRREQLGPVNPLAQDEYAEALARVEELETQRRDLETALRELASLIAETDRRIREAFEQTFDAAAANFEELVGQLFPGGRGRLRLVRDEDGPRAVLGGQPAAEPDAEANGGPPEAETDAEDEAAEAGSDEPLGVEIEMTPAGKSMKRLSLLSGGEKSLTALAFLFAIFLARPCPFYILDEVEAALDDLNIDRFLTLLRAHSDRAQFIVVTHQKRTMEAADTLYGVSMGDDGVSKVISRRLPAQDDAPAPAQAVA